MVIISGCEDCGGIGVDSEDVIGEVGLVGSLCIIGCEDYVLVTPDSSSVGV